MTKKKTIRNTLPYIEPLPKNNKVSVGVKGVRGNYRAFFTIGVQTFYVCDARIKSEAKWYASNLKWAFVTVGLEVTMLK